MVALPPCWSTRRYASTYFGENQLAPGSIGISTVTRLVGLPLLVSSRFHVLFHSPPGVLFTFPSRYCFTIGHTVVLSLTRWSSQIHTEFHVLRATRDTARSTYLSITGLSPSVARHSNVSSRLVDPYCCPTTPIVKTIGLGCSPFARRY